MREAYFHEDDYLQVEALPIASSSYCLAQLARIGKFSSEHVVGFGWTQMYVREENPQRVASLKVAVDAVASSLDGLLPAYDRVLTGYSSYRQEAKRTLALGSEDACIVFAGYDSNRIVQDIWFDFGIADDAGKTVALSALLQLGKVAELVMVDWGAGALVRLDDRDNLLEYFELRTESRAHALRAMRKYFDDQDKKNSG